MALKTKVPSLPGSAFWGIKTTFHRCGGKGIIFFLVSTPFKIIL